MRGGRALTAAGSCRVLRILKDALDGDLAHIRCTLGEGSPASEKPISMIQTLALRKLYALIGLLVPSHSAYKLKSHS